MIERLPRNLSTAQKQLQNAEYTCLQLVEAFIHRIKEFSHLNAFLEIFEESALSSAKEVDEKIKSGHQGRLAGMVLAIKDNICYTNHKVSASSKILEGFVSPYTATALQRLIDEDCIIIGRCNCDEFAMGASNENSAFGIVRNYDNEKCVPGGSSGGSAVAVQAGLCIAALGSDTGGSIRQPAAFTNTIGLKPTYGRISRYGLLAYASSFDQIGPITNTSEDAALLLEIMSGKDVMDATSSNVKVSNWGEKQDKKYKISYIKETLESEGLQLEVKTKFFEMVGNLKNDGHEVKEVSFPFLNYMVPCYYVLTTAEASSNLSRFSGMIYGHRSSNATDIESTFKKSRSEGFGAEVKRRIMTGTFVLSADFYDAYYTQAQKVRRIILNETLKLLQNCDFILSPTTPTTAFKIGGEKSKDPLQMYLADIFTVHASLAGLPAVSVPIGRDKSNLSIGLQAMSGYFNEMELLHLCSIIQTYEKN
jgi:aspartyl-tRNA(Asn)/glutamyl-tRNA(Gln) amidotransferase subunit A